MIEVHEVKRKCLPHSLWALCLASPPRLTLLRFPEWKNHFFWQFGVVPSRFPFLTFTNKWNREILLNWLILFILFLNLKVLLILFFSPALILVFALGSLGLILALTVNRHKHPLNLYLLFGFVSILTISVTLTLIFSCVLTLFIYLNANTYIIVAEQN